MNVFGELSVLLQIFPNSSKVIRLRREHCEVVESFSANPPICPDYWKDTRQFGVQGCPGDPDAIWRTPRRLWYSGTLAKIWWYIDEVELEWRALLDKRPELMYKEFFWKKYDASGEVKQGDSFENVVHTLMTWVGIGGHGAHNSHVVDARQHVMHKSLTAEIKSSAAYTEIEERIEQIRTAYLNALEKNPGMLAVRDSSASAQCPSLSMREITRKTSKCDNVKHPPLLSLRC